MFKSTTSSRRVGPMMSAVASFVAANPGLAMLAAARAVGPNGSLNYGYRTVHRAIKAGLVRADRTAAATYLYPVEVA